MKKHYYNRICSDCGRRFRSLNRMAPRCRTCVEALNVTIEKRDLYNSELGMVLRTETRGRAVIGAHAAGYNRSI